MDKKIYVKDITIVTFNFTIKKQYELYGFRTKCNV